MPKAKETSHRGLRSERWIAGSKIFCKETRLGQLICSEGRSVPSHRLARSEEGLGLRGIAAVRHRMATHVQHQQWQDRIRWDVETTRTTKE